MPLCVCVRERERERKEKILNKMKDYDKIKGVNEKK